MAISWLLGMAKWARGKSRTPNGNRCSGRPVYWRVWLEQLGKREVLSTFTVINTNDSGVGSLRQAILDANAHANSPPGSPDFINFNIPGSGVHTISLAAALPTITDPVDIDGSSQPGYSGTPLIELDGTTTATTVDGISLGTGSVGSTIQALGIGGFGTGIVIAADG